MVQPENPDVPSLLQRVSLGDADAVGELMARYRPLVWSIVRKRVAHDAAEDVVQEVFIQLWKSAARFDPKVASEATFVSTVARRRLVDRQRRDQVRGGTEPLFEGIPDETDEFSQVDTQDEAAWAQEALERIRPEEQRVLRMAISGLSHREIAERTETPLGTVKSHARRGLERVRRLLGEPEEQEAEE